MLKSFVRLTTIAIVCGASLHNSASACDTVDNQITIFSSQLPSTYTATEPNEFAGVVTFHLKRSWFFFKQDESAGFIGHVYESPTHPHLVGKKIDVLPVLGTSCGPYLSEGDSGPVTGSFLSTDGDELILALNSHRMGFLGLIDIPDQETE